MHPRETPSAASCTQVCDVILRCLSGPVLRSLEDLKLHGTTDDRARFCVQGGLVDQCVAKGVAVTFTVQP